MAAPEPNPFLEAKPPATDDMTYLTIIEYNLSKENVSTLHDVLRADAQLTVNIGWDLVQLLIPLLPDSRPCLEVIAHFGNPREVVLKVTEALRLLDFDSDEGNNDSAAQQEDGEEHVASGGPGQAVDSATASLGTDATSNLTVMQFQTLLAMLSILHPRIKTKYPGRFLSTSLQAILATYQGSASQTELLTDSIIAFLKAITGSKRPRLPPRTSSGNILKATTTQSAPDPEGTSDATAVEDVALQARLLQSFLTHVLEDYMLLSEPLDDVPGMAWCSRYMEKMHPERIPTLPGRKTTADRFASEDALIARSSSLGQLVAIADELKLLESPELIQICLKTPEVHQGEPREEEEPPAAAEDVPLSEQGALFLYAAGLARKALFATGGEPAVLEIFPDHARLLEISIGTAPIDEIGLQPVARIDAVLFLGLVSLERNLMGEPDEESFHQYLHTMSTVSANCPSPNMRYYAHYITTTVLRSHPSDMVRLGFIRDTLEHCPFSNLKGSAVGWLKGEIIEANLMSKVPDQSDDEHTIFSTPIVLSTLEAFLFPEISDDEGVFSAEFTFYVTLLNFFLFLFKATRLHDPLDIEQLLDNIEKWLVTLEGAVRALNEKAPQSFEEESGVITVVAGNVKEAITNFKRPKAATSASGVAPVGKA